MSDDIRPATGRRRRDAGTSPVLPSWREMFTVAWWQGLWRRITGRADRPGMEERPVPRPVVVEEPSQEFTILTPAKGDGFPFSVRVRCDWEVSAMADDDHMTKKTAEVRQSLTRLRGTIQERVEAAIRPIARQYPPYRPAEAERAIGPALVSCMKDGEVKGNIRVWVDVCEPVRKDLEEVWRQRLLLDAQGEHRRVLVEQLRLRRDQWQEILLQSLRGVGEITAEKATWIAPYAMALAQEEGDATQVLRYMLKERFDESDRLFKALSDLVVDHRELEEFDFIVQSDSALRSLLHHLGVPVAPQENDGGRALEGARDGG
ncbi:hypothetical protein [Sphaerisporangium dianthi]|uniref:Uncharacterized protein n=1 Tax=Sphaerisporangium dianthi TaxID=1436120 RepID=A0ABV9CM24_9ACTN